MLSKPCKNFVPQLRKQKKKRLKKIPERPKTTGKRFHLLFFQWKIYDTAVKSFILR